MESASKKADPAAQSITFPKFTPVLPKTPEQPCSINDLLYGPRVEPELRIRGYSEDEFENFVREWAFYYCQLQQKRYIQVGRFGGAGDMGRDVVGYLDPVGSGGRLDIFQCKHYGHGLHPGDVWTEIGKLLYYTYQNAFAVPERYQFVCPNDVGADLGRLLEKTDRLRDRVIAEWPKKIEDQITSKIKVKLEGDLLAYVVEFDFSIISYKPLHEIIEQHKATPRYAPRFGGGLVINNLSDPTPPAQIQAHEQRYVEQLVMAYKDHSGDTITLGTLTDHQKLNKHFARSRERYFSAETLRLDVRDNLPKGVTFEQVQDQLFDAVVDIAENDSHSNGLERVDAVTNHAGNYRIHNHPLNAYIHSMVLKGICHQLANDDKLTWVPQ